MKRGRATLSLCAAAFLLSQAHAEPLEFTGYVGVDLSYFPQTGLYPEQLKHQQSSFVLAPEINWRSDNGDTSVNIRTFARVETKDKQRQHFDLREAYLRHEFKQFSTLVGINKVFWGVTESQNLVDIINQVDQLEYTDNDARLGQPMVALSTDQKWGALSAFIMTGFRKQEFPGAAGRRRFGLPISKTVLYGDDAGSQTTDYALRYYNSFGSFDLGLSAFDGTSREPVLTLNNSTTSFEAKYNRISQVGLDLQYTGDATLLKLEAIRRSGDELGRFEALVAGLEYTFYQICSSDGDLGVIAEYNYDNRGNDAPQTIFQKDFFLGARWAANDSQDTSVLFGSVVDLDDNSLAFQGEFQRRLQNGLSLQLQFKALGKSNPANLQYGFRRDDFVALSLQHYF